MIFIAVIVLLFKQDVAPAVALGAVRCCSSTSR